MCWVGGRDRLNRLFRQNSCKMTRFYVKTTYRTTFLVSFQFRSITCPQLHKMSVYHRSGKRTSSIAVQQNSTEAKSSLVLWLTAISLVNKLLAEISNSICWAFLICFILFSHVVEKCHCFSTSQGIGEYLFSMPGWPGVPAHRMKASWTDSASPVQPTPAFLFH